MSRGFPPLVCVRGFRDFARRRVEFTRVTATEVDAEVKGTQVQQVRLQIDNGSLAAGCTCVANPRSPATCRHVWATLLEIDHRGAFASLRTTQRPLAMRVLEARKGLQEKGPKATPAKQKECDGSESEPSGKTIGGAAVLPALDATHSPAAPNPPTSATSRASEDRNDKDEPTEAKATQPEAKPQPSTQTTMNTTKCDPKVRKKTNKFKRLPARTRAEKTGR